MKKNALLTFSWILISVLWGTAQETPKEDPVLFMIEDQPVHVSEFEYIYNKNNGDQADYSEESLREYLELYIRFKLKVQAARDMQLDTITSLREELEGYRNQLSKSYLVDKQVINKLTRELYERMQWDVELSHILIKLPRRPSPSDTSAAREKMMKARRELQKESASFKKVALQYSEDESVRKNKGYLGYLTAKFPDGYYALENAAYETDEGSVSRPVRTRSGYHIVKVHDKRPARGTMEAAHILIRTGEGDTSSARERIFKIYTMLEKGGNFKELARLYSEDENSADKGGYIGSFGINTYDQEFEDAAFSLEEDGAYSKPVKTRIGWHIIRRIEKKELPPYFKMKDRLKARISNDQRMEEARSEMIDRIKKESDFHENSTDVRNTLDSMNRLVLTYRWTVPQPVEEKVLFALGDKEYTKGDFYTYIKKNPRQRMQLGRRLPTEEAIQTLYEEFVSTACLDYEEDHLLEKYPEFRALMREYEEGILLFEATQRKVWNKASRDTAGLEKFYEQHKKNYMWDQRAQISVYEIKSSDASFIDRANRYIKTHKPREVVAKFNKDTAMVSYMQQTIEKGSDKAEDVSWKEGAIEVLQSDSKDLYRLRKTEKIIPPQPKALNEARGYIIADYQDYLEKQWIQRLRNKYEVRVKEDVLMDLVRK